ncbi:hypothetical protein [Marinobacter sp. MBR-105]
MMFLDVVQIVFGLGLVYLIWSAIIWKEWSFLIGIAALFVVPISVILISSYPIPGFGIIYVIWFVILFGSRDKGLKEDEAVPTVGGVAIKAAQYAFVTVLIAGAISLLFSGGASDGGCSRATPQFC